MADSSVTDYVSFINQEIESREVLTGLLVQAEALAVIALSNDFFDYPRRTLNAYLSTLSDIIEGAIRLNEEAVNALLASRKNQYWS